MHACDLADDLGVRKVVVPAHAGLFSAYGLLAGELERTFTAPTLGSRKDLGSAFGDLEARARREMKSGGLPSYSTRKFFEARYQGQSHELILPYRGNSRVESDFRERHRALYGYAAQDKVEVVGITIKLRVPRKAETRFSLRKSPLKRKASKRNVWVGGRFRRVDCMTLEALQPGAKGSGPCVIEEYDSTLLVNPGWSWKVEPYGTRLEK